MLNLKLTSAQSTVLQIGETLFASAIVTSGVAAYQYSTTSGFNGQVLLSVFMTGLLTAFFKGLVSLQSNPNTAQAAIDTIGQINPVVQATLGHVLDVKSLLSQQPAPQMPVSIQQPYIPVQASAAQSLTAIYPTQPAPIIQQPFNPTLPTRDWSTQGVQAIPRQ